MSKQKVAKFLPRTPEQMSNYQNWDVRVLRDTPCRRCGKVIPKGTLAYGNTTTVFCAAQRCPAVLYDSAKIMLQTDGRCAICGRYILKRTEAFWVRGEGKSELRCLGCGGGKPEASLPNKDSLIEAPKGSVCADCGISIPAGTKAMWVVTGLARGGGPAGRFRCWPFCGHKPGVAPKVETPTMKTPLTAQKDQKCAACGGDIKKGEQVIWMLSKGTMCLKCDPEAPIPQPVPKDAVAEALRPRVSDIRAILAQAIREATMAMWKKAPKPTEEQKEILDIIEGLAYRSEDGDESEEVSRLLHLLSKDGFDYPAYAEARNHGEAKYQARPYALVKIKANHTEGEGIAMLLPGVNLHWLGERDFLMYPSGKTDSLTKVEFGEVNAPELEEFIRNLKVSALALVLAKALGGR